ncbi:MAG TPA: neutral/alkaline non-lysosomal ceramidase N-terminal domain-containing protein [Thermoleophilaceae bacterium]|nr:neutral/alkaline non-lysosomal ceramidase N-terminal domain-containing protein [Thermoleophilaceae bacterium]
MRLLTRRIFVLGALAALLSLPTAARAELTAGAANADITPPIGTPQFAYTARSSLAGGAPQNIPLQIVGDPDGGLYAKTFAASRGIHTRVRARAIVLDTGSERAALVQTDLGGIPYALVQRVYELIPETGIPLENIMIAATHTHSSTGPIWPADSTGYAVLGGDLFDARVFEFTAQGIARAIAVANSYRAPAKLGIARTHLRNASRNRNFEPFLLNEDVPKEEEAARRASIDPVMTVIRVDETDGRPIGVWSNFAIHETSFGDENLLFSGDNAAFTERIVEQEIRRRARAAGTPARRPETVVNVWTNSNEGDISPDGGADRVPAEEPPAEPPPEGEEPTEPLQYSTNSFTGAHMAGMKVARGVLRAWRRAGRQMVTEIPFDGRLGYVAFDGAQADGEPVGPNAILGSGGIVAEDGTCAPFDGFAGPGQGMKMLLLGGPGDSLVPGTQPISIFRLGALAITALPSEVTRQMGQRIRDAVKAESGGAFDHVVLSGLTNGYSSYTATPEEYDACHYEGSFTLFGRQQGALYRDSLVSVSEALLAGTAYAGDPEPSYKVVPGEEPTMPEATPNAGTPVEQPADSVTRYGRAKFSWNGGHPSIDAPRAGRLVITQRQGRKRWRRVATDDGFYDILERNPETDVWTTTFQTTDCMQAGTYRFLVQGRADTGDGPENYTIESDTFVLEPIRDIVPRLTVEGRRARVTATYPAPHEEDTLLALPRRVRSGHVVLGVKRPGKKERRVRAKLTKDRLAFRARVPRKATVRVIRVADACGNTGAPAA